MLRLADREFGDRQLRVLPMSDPAIALAGIIASDPT